MKKKKQKNRTDFLRCVICVVSKMKKNLRLSIRISQFLNKQLN